MREFLVALLVFLVACSNGPVQTKNKRVRGPDDTPMWWQPKSGESHYLLYAAGMPEKCVESSIAALDLMESYGIVLDVRISGSLELPDPGVDNAYEDGVIKVYYTDVIEYEGLFYLGMAYRRFTEYRRFGYLLHAHIQSAVVALASCEPAVAIHEFGHVMGLEHAPDTTNYMYFSAQPVEQRFTEDQIEWMQRTPYYTEPFDDGVYVSKTTAVR